MTKTSRAGHVRLIVHAILDAKARDSALARAGNVALATLIVINVLAVILETLPSIGDRFADAFADLEGVSVAVFTVEYLLRLWTCTLIPGFEKPILGRVRFIATPLAIIDLIAILPAYLPGEVFVDLRFARSVRLVRMLRALKVTRYSRTVQTFANVFRDRKPDLMLIAGFLLLFLVLASSSMYYVEHAAQPKVFSSIPAAMWWGVATLTTVGYGDIYPITPVGKFLGSLIALIGIGFFALPAGVLAAAFADQLQKSRAAEPTTCPHCGKSIA